MIIYCLFKLNYHKYIFKYVKDIKEKGLLFMIGIIANQIQKNPTHQNPLGDIHLIQIYERFRYMKNNCLEGYNWAIIQYFAEYASVVKVRQFPVKILQQNVY